MTKIVKDKYMYISTIYTGGQKFGILKLISFSFKNKLTDKFKNLCLVKFGVLGYKTHKNDSASCSYQIHRSVQSGRGA